MKWIDEFKLWVNGTLPEAEADLEGLLMKLNVSRYNIAETKFGKTGLNTYEAQQGIQKELNYRWRARLAVLTAMVIAMGAFVRLLIC